MVNFNPNNPDDWRKQFESIVSQQKDSDLDALNEKLRRLTDDYNGEPQSYLRGYSPAMAFALQHPWDSPGSPIQFAHDLPLAELEGAKLFTQIRQLLMIVRDAGTVKATQSGNFNRKFVESTLDSFVDAELKADILSVNKVLNEPDVWPLHEARIVADCAKLLAIRKGQISMPKKYHFLLEDDKAGQLFHRLFDAYFTVYNIGYRYCWGIDWLQHEIKFVLYPLFLQAQDWLPIKGITEKLMHPMVYPELQDEIRPSTYFTEDDIFTDYLLNPLNAWGLLEMRYQKEKRYSKVTHVRTNPLFKKFIRFNTNP
jgi:hypothetical protein